MRPFSEVWKDSCSESIANAKGAAGELMALIGNKLGVDQVEYSSIRRVALFLFDLSDLGFKGMDLNVVMIAHPPSDDVEAKEQAELLTDYKNTIQSVGFCFLIQLSNTISTTNPYIPSSLETIFISGRDLERLMDSTTPESVLFEIIRRQVQLHRLCPFNTSHEARSDTFRGRKRELERLVYEMESNFLVSGGRRIGKTSLIKRAYNVLRVAPEYRSADPRERRVFYFNCLTWGGHLDCFSWLCHYIDPKREPRIQKAEHNVAYMLQRRSFNGTRPLLLFFDEMDGVVDTDIRMGWPFFNLLADAVSKNWIRVTFAGYRSMRKLLFEAGCRSENTQKPTIGSPFHAALQEVALEPLTKEQTFSLVRDPFKSIEMQFRDETEVLDRIWRYSAGNPWVIQFLCEELFQKMSEGAGRDVTVEDLDEIEAGYKANEFLLSHFIENTSTGPAQPVTCEQLCVLLFAHDRARDSWSEGDFVEACGAVCSALSLDEIHQALSNLYHTRIFSFSRDHYLFTLPMLRDKLCRAYPKLDIVVEQLLKHRR